MGDVTVPSESDWANPAPGFNGHDAPTERGEQPVISKVEQPGHLTMRTDSGELLPDYVLEKFRVSIGRAPSSDILLSKDKLTSRNHASITYEASEYILRDEGSANGTFVNGQQLDEKTPYKLRDGDHVGIGEYELVFHASAVGSVDIESMPTVMVSAGAAQTFSTHEDPLATHSSADDFGTSPWESDASAARLVQAVAEKAAQTPIATAEPEPVKVAETPLPATPATSMAPAPASGGVTFSRLTSLPQPQLPDVAPLMAALATLDGQVSSLQEQLNSTQDALRNHDAEIAQTTNQLRDGVRNVSERMDSTIAEVARSREQLAWTELLQLMEDVMNNPRDIEYVTKLARKARELNKVFQIHQNVLTTLAECTSQLRDLIGE
jgi:pSer/pThr/pTyr-binding forkhead associated (FHA) protein